MPLFSRFKNKGSQPATKGKGNTATVGNGAAVQPRQTGWQSRWESIAIVPEEVQELVHVCTAEMKTRAEALDAPFLLLPFRPDSDPQGARTFIRNYYKANAEESQQYRGEGLKQELRLTDSDVLCSVLKWCWSRMPSGVVSWPVYEGFRIGEQEAHFARNAFDTFIPISCDSEARKNIIFDYYDLLSAVAAHGKMNGLTGRKLSRLAGWWAFDHSDGGKGFEGGYKSWTTAADASSHLFFAYLRSLSPETDPSMNVIERIPRSLQALVASTEYPPETPTLLQRSTPRVVMLVDTVSPTPFALLRRAKHFEYRDRDRVLREFSEFEDPVDALTDECKRVLYAVSSANQSMVARSRQGLTKPEESWSAFQNMGFADLDERSMARKQPNGMGGPTKTVGQGLRNTPRSLTADGNRPTTPSWADFLSSGFADDGSNKSPALLYPPAQVLPPLGSRSSSPGMPGEEENLAPGELAAVTNVDLDDAFWWVWMTSLAGEEPSDRKAVFGRCALVETSIMNGRWLIMEEQVKGASPDPAIDAYIAPKKSFFSFTKRGRMTRKQSTKAQSQISRRETEQVLSATPSKTSISMDQHAKIKAAARALTQGNNAPEPEHARRGRIEDAGTKTNSVLTMGLQSEAGPAMKWASTYDKKAIRTQYLGDAFAGRGMSREDLARNVSSVNLGAGDSSSVAPATSVVSPTASAFHDDAKNRDLPPTPNEQSTILPAAAAEARASTVDVLDATRVPEQDVPSMDADRFHENDSSAPIAGLARPESQRQQATIGHEHGVSIESVTSQPQKVERKPVRRPDEHPALRSQEVHEAEPMPATPQSNPAAVAAARAMQTTASTSPEALKATKLKKPVGHSGGFRKFFGKKKDTHGESGSTARPGSDGLAPPSEQGLGRKISLMRKKRDQNASPKTSTPAFAAPSEQDLGMQEPVVTATQFHDDYVPPASSRGSTAHEHEAAEREFSRFDQGPMSDMPAVMPIDSTEDPSPLPQEDTFDDYTAMPSQHAGAEPLSHERVIRDDESEATMEDRHDPELAQDRWATIRENAQRRAAKHREERQSEEQSMQSRPSHSARTDDGETSGEETIESRVARIKARVAELTGNMDAVPRA